MEKQTKWEVKIVVGNKDCVFADDDVCTLSICGDNHCTYENCPRRVPLTCKDCRYLFFNQNPKEELKGELKSTCGIRGHKIVHTGDMLESGHYRTPGWCPARYDVSNVETFESIED